MFDPIPDVLEAVRAGEFIVLVDDEDRENEGDLVLAAQHATPEKINQLLRLAAGYLCLSLAPEDCDRLNLHDQASVNTSVRQTPFTVSIDAHPKHGVTTGVSAFDRASTIALAIDADTSPDDFVRPGHINPLRSREGGVLVRVGQTEGSVDLARLAGLHPSALIIEIVNPDGTMARRDDLAAMCREHGWKMCSVEQLISYRLERESLVKRLDPANGTPIATPYGTFNLIAYESIVDPLPHLALTMGDVGTTADIQDPVLVRMHRRDLLGDIFHQQRTNNMSTADQLQTSMRRIAEEGRGVIVYMRPEGHGSALDQRLLAIKRHGNALDADAPDLTTPSGAGANSVPMHHRAFGIGSQILRDLGVHKLRLLTNTPKELPALEAFSLEITEYVDLQ
ncbi:MAG: 3,4-dihydroxy-2-butanone-4-phosphate synthase [Planctomycetota bacterium]